MEFFKRSAHSLIIRAERTLQTDIHYLLKGGSWLLIGQIISSVSLFFLSIAFANILSPETYGLYKYILSIVALLLISTLSGVDVSVTQSVARTFEGSLFPGLWIKMRWALLGSAGSIALAIYYYAHDNNVFAIAFIITAIFLPLTDPFDIYNSLLQGKKLFKTFTLFNSLTQILSATSIFITLLFTKNLIILIIVFFASNTLLNIIFFILSIRFYPPNNKVDQEVLMYGKKLSALYIVSLVANELDKLVVFHYLGAASLAIYTIALAPTEQIKGILKNVQFLIAPKMAENIHKDILPSLFRKIFIFGLFVAICILGYIVFSPFLFKIFFPKYLLSIHYSQLIAISIIAASTSPILYSYLETKRSTKQLGYFHIFSNIINISLLLIFVYFWGLIGVIIARILSRFLILGLTAILAKQAERERLEKTF